MTDANNTLNITGDATDSVNSVDTSGWTQSSTTDDGTSTTYEYTKDGASDSITLVVEDDINHTGM